MEETERRPRTPLPKEEVPDAPPTTRSPWMRPRFITLVLGLLALNYILMALLNPGTPTSVRVPYSPFFLTQVERGNVAKIRARTSTIDGTFVKPISYEGSEKTTHFKTEIPVFADQPSLERTLRDNRVVISAEPLTQARSLLLSVLLGFGPVLLIIGLFVALAKRGAGMGAIGSFGRSRARRVDTQNLKVTFADVAGIDEAKAELAEIVDFLRNPDRYRALGGRIPRGVLLSGRPGTGKTLLARAIAGEADVPFFSSSASEFVEAIVGIGASRVRDLFRQAKEASPSIIFIDELDAIGRSRGGNQGFGGGNDEREQTLNQILTEMDGFDSDAAVIVLGATNRPEILDPALLRPGRFDRRVTVPAPDRDGRQKILLVHTRSLPLAADVDPSRIAAVTPGMVGADLANLANEAALLAARRNHTEVEMADFTDALEKIVLGAPRGVLLSEADRRRTAYHEAGHAVVGMLTPGADPVRKVSIIPRGSALGVTFSAPDDDRSNYDEPYLLARIRVALGGRVAEEIACDTITSGAEGDIQQLTELARHMVGRWGMSEAIGPIAALPADGAAPYMPGASGETSEQTRQLVDTEVRRIVDEALEDVRRMLTEHRGKLESLTAALLEQETLDQDAAYSAAGVTVSLPTETRAPASV